MGETGYRPDGSYVPCPACRWEPPVERHPAPGRPIRMPGTTHHGDCPTIPQLTAAERQELADKLDEMDRVRRRGAAAARNYILG